MVRNIIALMQDQASQLDQFKAGKRQALGFSVPRLIQWAVDRERFLVAVPRTSLQEPYTVVMNWQATLRR